MTDLPLRAVSGTRSVVPNKRSAFAQVSLIGECCECGDQTAPGVGDPLRRERQMEGIARARANGVYRGRKPSIDGEAVLMRSDNTFDFDGLRSRPGQAAAIMVAYDIMEVDRQDVRPEALEERRKSLRSCYP